MEIRGLINTSLIDYPGEICATLFTGGCNLRCPFCHNRELVLAPEKLPLYPEEDILDLFRLRSGLLGGICITGGEPTMQEGLINFIMSVKSTGLKVKLDSNGTRPRVLQKLLDRGLLDYVAVDIKAPRAKYSLLAGVDGVYEAVAQTIAILQDSPVEHEFRTTFVPALLETADIVAIAGELAGCSRYIIQRFQPGTTLLDPALGGTFAPDPEMMEKLAQRCRAYVATVDLRG